MKRKKQNKTIFVIGLYVLIAVTLIATIIFFQMGETQIASYSFFIGLFIILLFIADYLLRVKLKKF